MAPTDLAGHGIQSVAMSRFPYALSATITAGQSLSNVIDVGGTVLFAVAMPVAWTAAALTFQASDDPNGTFGDVYDDAGLEVAVLAVNVVAGRILVPAGILENLAPLRYLKIRSGLAALPVAQLADRTLKLLVKG